MNEKIASGEGKGSVEASAEAAARDFVARFEKAPESISSEEAFSHYQAVAPQLSPADHEATAQEAFARMSPEQRLALGRYLIGQAQQHGVATAFPDANHDGIDDRLQDPQYLAQVSTQANQQTPGWLGGILSGLGSPVGGGAPTSSGVPSGNAGGFLGGTAGKVALGGIAALGLSRLLGGSGHGGGLLGGGGHGGGLFGGDGNHGGGHDGGHHGGH